MLPDEPLPYRIATLCDLRDSAGRVLLLHRRKPPNQHLYSPVGGKLDIESGESPAACAHREIEEETGLDIPIERLHLLGLVAETAFEGRAHWLMFLYRVRGPVELAAQEIDEGRLEWHTENEVDALSLPETDRRVIWPLIRRHEPDGFFAVHIDCRGEALEWTVEQSTGPGGAG
ncbi:MAG: NUDIX domain-containing protein [Planctomycetota bacterium]